MDRAATQQAGFRPLHRRPAKGGMPVKFSLATLLALAAISIAGPAHAQNSMAESGIPNERTIIEETRGSDLAPPPNDQLLLNSTMPHGDTPSTTKGPFYHMSENELRTRKLSRGLANVVLCVGEIPNQMFQQAYRTSPITGVFVGAGKGLIKGGKRLMIGTWEVLTFFHPTKNYYQPYIQPEVVFQEYLH